MKLSPELKNFLRPYWYAYNRAMNPLRQLVVKLCTLSSPSSLEWGPPKGYYPTTQDWFTAVQSQSNHSGCQYQEIYPSQTIIRNIPKSFSTNNFIHWKFKQNLEHQQPVTFVAQVPQGRVLWEAGTVITAEDKLLGDVSVEHRRTIQEHGSFTCWQLSPVHRIPGKAAVLSTQGSDIYFHWLFDVLPRLELIKKVGYSWQDIDYFIFSSYHRPFQIETLQLLGIEAEKIIISREYLHLQVDQLIVPSWSSIPGQIPSWVCEFLRQSFLPLAQENLSNLSKRFYISRSQAGHRQVTNETELIEFLISLGFEVVILEKMNFVEQVSLFAQAEFIIAPHGAGLSNLVFCSPKTKVIELFSPNYVEIHYWTLCDRLNLDYYYLIGEGKSPREYTDPGWIWDNIQVSCQKIQQLIDKMN